MHRAALTPPVRMEGNTLFLCLFPGSVIFVKWKEGLWCRANVVEVLQNDCVEVVKSCPITQLARVRVFFLDYGLTKNIHIQRYTQSVLLKGWKWDLTAQKPFYRCKFDRSLFRMCVVHTQKQIFLFLSYPPLHCYCFMNADFTEKSLKTFKSLSFGIVA